MSKTNDLLRDAIADANAVKKLAIDNARQTLLESFQPKIQSMLSTRIREEEEQEEPAEEAPVEQPAAEEAPAEEAPAPAEEAPVEEGPSMSDEGEEDLDLEAVIRELDAASSEEMDPAPEVTEAPETEPEMTIDEVIASLREEESTSTEEKPAEEEAPAESDKTELAEAIKVIKILQKRLQEVNMVNAKLLFSMNVFRNHPQLSESQKMAIIDQFDRAANVREVKLVYATLAESLKGHSTPKRPTTTALVRESSASRPVAGTTRTPEITAASAIEARFKKLAKLNK